MASESARLATPILVVIDPHLGGIMRTRTTLNVLGAVAVAASLAVTGCRKAPADPPPAAEPESTVTEQSDNGSISWNVETDGRVRAEVKDKDGRRITKGITGTMTWPGEWTDDYAEVSLDANGYLVAQGPALKDDLTEIDYTLVIDGKPWAGVLHVPRGGTRALDEDAKVAVDVPAGKTGPNGGTIQYIHGEPVELVADKDTGEVRIYVLGPDFKVVEEPGERSFRIGYVAEVPETVVLVREPGMPYYVGRWRARMDPFRVTVAMTVGVETHCAIVGWRFGAPLAWSAGWSYGVGFGVGVGVGVGFGVGVGVPVFRFAASRHWAPSVSVRAGYDVRVRERVSVRVNEHVNVHERGGGSVKVNEHINVHERGGGSVKVNEHVNVHEKGGGGRTHVNEHTNVHEKGGGGPSRGGGHSAPSHGGGGGRKGGRR
jgi:hypothetical protein